MDSQNRTLSQDNIISFSINKQNTNIIWTLLCSMKWNFLSRWFAALKQKDEELILFSKILVLICTINFGLT